MSKSKQNNRLFVYGIFLGENNRKEYGMTNPKYATVLDYTTFGHTIVRAVPVKVPDTGERLSLTGLVVDVDPRMWKELDELEAYYDRIIVETSYREPVYMYVDSGTNKQKNYSTYVIPETLERSNNNG